MILALDTATRVGWASGEPGGEPEWGVADFASRSGTGEVLSGLQGTHGSLESGGRDQAHVAFICPSRDRPEDVR